MAELEKVKKKKKKKKAVDQSVTPVGDQATTETKKVKKSKSKKVAPTKEETVETPTAVKAPKLAGMKKDAAVKDTSDQLPPAVQQRKIVCKEVGETNVTRVELSDVTATSKSIYVEDIHCANPRVLQTIYWVILQDSRHVIARVTEDEYNYILSKTAKKLSHLVSVVDCSVVPTLSYGSWQVSQIKGDFPSAAQIAAQDAEFKKNPTGLHNPPVKIEIYEAQQAQEDALKEVAATTEDDSEEEFEIDFTDEDDTDELDFSEDKEAVS